MRILHTSDWHLGRAFHGVGMLSHQAEFLDHLVEVVETERVDLVVVSGDVFDRGLPPTDALRVYDEAICRLAETSARVVIASGNHDSAARLGLGSRLIDVAGVHVRADASRVAEPIIVPDAHGEVAVYGIPYLDPDVTRRSWSLDHRSHEAALGEAMRRVHADLSTRGSTRSVVLAHAFVAGGQPSESERDIAVGGVSRVPVSMFDGVSYAALGHLHGRQQLSEHVRYSGSPLAYSFSEAGHQKGCWLIDLGSDGVEASQWIPAPVPRRLARLRGSLVDLLIDPALAAHEESWLQVTLTDAVRPREPMEQLRTRFPHALALDFERPTAAGSTGTRNSVVGQSDHSVELEFVEAVRGTAATETEALLLRDAVEACCGDPDADVVVA